MEQCGLAGAGAHATFSFTIIVLLIVVVVPIALPRTLFFQSIDVWLESLVANSKWPSRGAAKHSLGRRPIQGTHERLSLFLV
jgi:hypothetical protein